MPVLILVALLVGAGGLTLYLTRNLTFYQDTWWFLMGRRAVTWDTVFAPHNEHIVVFPVLIEQGLLRVFGMTSARPEYVLSMLGLLASASLLFVYLRRRVGDWLALFGVSLVLFLGPAWEVLLWPFEIGFVGSAFFGLAALLALERGDRRGDVAACAFLVLSVGFSSLGIAFLAGGAVAVALGPRGQRLSRAYIVAIPVLLFGAWYQGWGHEAESHFSFENVLKSPKFVAETISANVGSALGLNPDPTSDALGRGANAEPGLNTVWNQLIALALAIAVAIAVAMRRKRGAGPSARVWAPVAAIAFSSWFLTAFNAIPGREPPNSRYQYMGAIFVLMLLAALFDGVRLKRPALVVAGAVAALALIPHIIVLGRAADFLDEQSALTRADTAALEIARETVAPEFELTDEVAGTPTLLAIFAGEYFNAIAEYGSPAYTPAELEAASERARFQADVVLSRALPIGLSTKEGAFTRSAGGCTVLPPNGGEEVALAPGTTTRIEIAPGPDATFLLRRFGSSSEYPVRAEGEPGGSVSELTIPADTLKVPWHLRVEAEQRVRVCG